MRFCLVAVLAAGFSLCVSVSALGDLSPPIIKRPIYDCAEVIRFSGACRDSEITIYRNGSVVGQFPTFWGFGTYTFTNPLSDGDVISATQTYENETSVQSRDPVTVAEVPEEYQLQEKLDTPSIDPIYECQRMVRISDLVEGAKVTARDWDATTYRGQGPDGTVVLGTPEIRLDMKWFNAYQKLCNWESDWTPHKDILPRPSTIPAPTVVQPVEGSDVCVVLNLFPGAVFKIFGSNQSNAAEDCELGEELGEWVATAGQHSVPLGETATSDRDYCALQALCDLEVPSPKVSTQPIYKPSIVTPLCAGEHLITMCGTYPRTIIRVYINGDPTAAAQGSGDYGCTTLALAGNRVFQTGDRVVARMFVDGDAGPESETAVVQATGAPAYEPNPWNQAWYHRCRNNCYNYACNIMNDLFAQPGRAHGVDIPDSPYTCSDVRSSAIADGLQHNPERNCDGCTHVEALVLDPLTPAEAVDDTLDEAQQDYHWYRLDDTGYWSHKPGSTPATNLDKSGAMIVDPEAADRGRYTEFCTYFCVDRKLVEISGSVPSWCLEEEE